MQDVLFSPIPLEQLKNEIASTLRAEVLQLAAKFETQTPPEYLTRKKTAELLGVSLATLNTWTKEGKVKGYRIGARVRYKRAELETALKAIKGVAA